MQVSIIREIKAHRDAACCLAYSSDSQHLASASADQTIKIWMNDTGICKCTLCGHSESVNAIAFNSDSSLLASASDDCTVRIWCPNRGDLLYTLTDHNYAVFSVAFSPSGSTLASGGFDKTVRIWMLPEPHNRPCVTLSGHSDSVYAVAFNHSGALLASGSRDRSAKLWSFNATKGGDGSAAIPRDVVSPPLLAPVSPIWRRAEIVRTVAFSPDGAHLATAGGDCAIRIWPMHAAATGNDSDTATAAADSWSAAAGPTAESPSARGGPASPPGGGGGSNLNQPGGDSDAVRLLTGHTNVVMSVAWSPDGALLASAAGDGSVRLWCARTGALLASLSTAAAAPSPAADTGRAGGGAAAAAAGWRPPLPPALCVAFDPRGNAVAAAVDSGAVRVWDLVGAAGRLAVAMARCPRLGAASPLAALEPELLAFIANLVLSSESGRPPRHWWPAAAAAASV